MAAIFRRCADPPGGGLKGVHVGGARPRVRPIHDRKVGVARTKLESVHTETKVDIPGKSHGYACPEGLRRRFVLVPRAFKSLRMCRRLTKTGKSGFGKASDRAKAKDHRQQGILGGSVVRCPLRGREKA